MALIKIDGVVGHWFRWHLLGVAATTLTVYAILILASLIVPLLDLPFSIENPLDYRALLLTIPAGILRGDAWYERDREANEPKVLPEQKRGDGVNSWAKGTDV